MDTIVLQPSNAFELSLLEDFIQKTQIKSRVISEDDKEDFVLGMLMQETDYQETIDTAAFLRSLQGK